MSDAARRSKRFPANHALRVKCETWERFVQHYAGDVSDGGMFIVTDDPPPLLEVIEVELDLPEGHTVPLKARVVHVVGSDDVPDGQHPGVGVEFIDLDEQQKRQVHHLVEFARWQGAPGKSSFASHMFELTAPQPIQQVVASLPPSETRSTRPSAEPADARRTTSSRPTRLKRKSVRKKRRRVAGDPRATGEFLKERESVAPERGSQAPGSEAASAPAPQPTDPLKLKEGMKHLARRRNAEAAEVFSGMLANNPGDPEAGKWLHIARARVSLAQDDEAAAASHYEKALELDESHHEARRFVRDYHRRQKLAAIPFGRLFTKR
ncbi:MAG: PilZ domain-containing protein [Myxococcales bacterium]